MKHLKQGITVILLLVAVVSYGQHKMNHKHNHDKGDMKMEEMQEIQEMALEFNNKDVAASYQHYVHVKTALVNSDSNEAQKGATMLAKALKNVNGGDKAQKAANSLTVASNIKDQRNAFSSLSNAMTTLVKDNIRSGKIYKDFCPMALNTGAYWLSSNEEIQNPYFGDKMLKCGSINETIQ